MNRSFFLALWQKMRREQAPAMRIVYLILWMLG
jgi:hypothetical protein